MNLEVPYEFTIRALGDRQNITVCGTGLKLHTKKKDTVCSCTQILEVHFSESKILRAYPQVIILDQTNQPLIAMSLKLTDYHLLRKYFILQNVSVYNTYQKW